MTGSASLGMVESRLSDMLISFGGLGMGSCEAQGRDSLGDDALLLDAACGYVLVR